MIELADYEGSPLEKLEQVMGWGITFSSSEFSELRKFLKCMGPLEKLFLSLNCDKSSNIHKVYPSIQVYIYLSLLFERRIRLFFKWVMKQKLIFFSGSPYTLIKVFLQVELYSHGLFLGIENSMSWSS